MDSGRDTSRDKRPPGGRGTRFLKLAGMTTSVMGTYARARMKSLFSSEEEARESRAATYLETGQRIAKTLGELKGAVMKVGQMASIGSDLLPPELSQALGSLQKEAPPVPFEVIEGQIERELGAAPEILFSWFDREPFAAASIGQVHRATTDDGREVVVKVQYPGVDVSVDSDLAQLKLALRAAGFIRLRRKVLNELFAEVRARLHEELDYTNEAENVRLFQEFHRKRGDTALIVPDVVGERSSQRVLTLTYEPGDPLSSINERGYSQEERDRIGTAIISNDRVPRLRAPRRTRRSKPGQLRLPTRREPRRVRLWVCEATRFIDHRHLQAPRPRLPRRRLRRPRPWSPRPWRSRSRGPARAARGLPAAPRDLHPRLLIV